MESQLLQPLPYARPVPTPPRPAMYRLVFTILFAGLVIVSGVVASITFYILMFQARAGLFSLVPLAIAALFFYMGIRSLTVVLRFLRGKPPGEHWERWVFTVWSSWM